MKNAILMSYFATSPLPFAASILRFFQYAFIRRLTAFRAAALIGFRKMVPDTI